MEAMLKSTFAQALFYFLILVSAGSLFSSKALGSNDEENPLQTTAQFSPFEFETNQIIEVKIEMSLPEGYRAYEEKFKLALISPDDGIEIGKIQIDPIKEFYDETTKKNKKGVIGQATLIAPIKFLSKSLPSEGKITFGLTYQACTKSFCLFPIVREVHALYKITKSSSAPSSTGVSVTSQGSFFSLSFQEVFQNKGLLWTFIFVFVAGLLTSLTPCVFPMIPITMAVLGKNAHLRTKKHNLLLAHLYVLGIALTYSSLGVFAAATGMMFGSFMSHPIVIGLICFIFIAMALSMFGLYDLQAPAFIRKRLSGDLHLKGYSSAFVYGVIAGVIASPCVGPVLVGILTFVAKTQNLWLGFWLLFVFALGMGQLFIVVGFSSQATKLLPKSGQWMNRVKYIFGVVMLGMAVYYGNLLLPSNFWSSLNQPKQGFHIDANNWQKYSDDLLAEAQKSGKPVMIDFWADWCAACKQIEQNTFTSQQFQLMGANFVLIKFDATSDSPKLQELKKKYEIVGLPTIVFHDRNGNWVKEATVNEFIEAPQFVEKMKTVLDRK